jgi:hypothetical protein
MLFLAASQKRFLAPQGADALAAQAITSCVAYTSWRFPDDRSGYALLGFLHEMISEGDLFALVFNFSPTRKSILSAFKQF